MSKKIVALIPARGGSKGIPKKNLQLVGGMPMIKRTVKTAVSSDVDEVWVSTDNKVISDTALDAGATACVRRPEELCQDSSNSEDALLHFAEKVDFDVLVFLQCTSPLTKPKDINKALEVYMSGKHDSLLSVCEDHGGWLCGGFTWKKEIRLPEYEGTTYQTAIRMTPYSHQRQNMEKRYRENGAIYITSKEKLLESKSRVSGKIGLYEMPKNRSFEIDSPEDLAYINRHLGYEEPSVIVHHPGERRVSLL
jgi:CMP-N,N'-diacetyllegionaminic acid synthase